MFSVFATLGEAVFSPRLSPSAFSARQEASFAEHALVSGAPRLQYTGRGLDTLSLSFDLHMSFCDPAAERKKLEAMLRGHRAHPLVFGNGAWWGYFALTSLSTTCEQCDPSGTPWLISMQAELREWAGDPAASPERPAVSSGTPNPAMLPSAGALSTMQKPAAGGGLWDAMRQAVSYAGQAKGAISEAAGLVSLAREVAQAGSPFAAISAALGGAERLGGLLGSAGVFSEGLKNALASAASALPLAEAKEALKSASELTGLCREGAALASALGINTGGALQVLSRADACLNAGEGCLTRLSPAMQRMSAQVAARSAQGKTLP